MFHVFLVVYHQVGFYALSAQHSVQGGWDGQVWSGWERWGKGVINYDNKGNSGKTYR